ncbi:MULTISPECIES: DUF3834 domain-containing protein [Acidianus]|uniref:DUF3834 domain-containing protein n=1 Tax=Candidatus Acidianus copahuensis TaxID=1160895 RepID=A0A031LPL5_9CREN|nr:MULTISPECIES: DUF3834 domain-containing protein [Acidianus]EZQ04743.1 hypothetical protein CM19_08490 [Candidatus Acidianus copahuensis]NON63548.1 DUF3834 domain-containing protein [Acidianus sp. RZ1]
MIITAPYAGPVSFPLLVGKELGKIDIDLRNSCKTSIIGDVILDSITNIASLGLDYKIVAAVYIDMYSILGDKNSKKLFTLRAGTLADMNARLYALYTGKEVINTDSRTAIEMAQKGYMAIVGNEIKLGESLEDEFKALGILSPSCIIYSHLDNNKNILDYYNKGISLISSMPKESAYVISSYSEYYQFDIMKEIVSRYNHRLTENKNEIKKSLELYSKVFPPVATLSL